MDVDHHPDDIAAITSAWETMIRSGTGMIPAPRIMRNPGADSAADPLSLDRSELRNGVVLRQRL